MEHKPAFVDEETRSDLLSKHSYRKFSLGKAASSRFEKFEELRRLSQKQCLSENSWPEVENVSAWMISAETATFMKMGGLGMVATELPEAFNQTFAKQGDKITVVTPLYIGDTSRKRTTFQKNVYTGSENHNIKVRKAAELKVPFINKNNVIENFKVKVYTANDGKTGYIFLHNRRFFSISTDRRNPGCKDGCYVLNKLGVDEVERFAFLSKAVFVLLRELCAGNIKGMDCPNILVANDWHSGALAGLNKYLTTVLAQKGKMDAALAAKLKAIPIIHLVHNMEYQGWDWKNTVKILNSLYGSEIKAILDNAQTYENTNPRIKNTLVVDWAYNQACCNLHLADRLVTVSSNYCEEVSKGADFGYDFSELLSLRKDKGNFVGIVNGYHKKLIAPLVGKIQKINHYFDGTDFRFYDENSIETKKHNKKEFIKLISRLAKDEAYKHKVVPLVNFYKFEDIDDLAAKADKIPMFCATSRLVEQKGYDIAAEAILKFLQSSKCKEAPIFVLGGAGGADCFEHLTRLKDKVAKISPEAARRIFVFRGYKDEFAYAIQLASDFYMMPSRFEPCGLNQMEAMAKGSVPVAMSTGGLVDTIKDGVDGFRTLVFYGSSKAQIYGTAKDAKVLKNNVDAFAEVIKKACHVFETEPAKLNQMVVNAMKQDFSWNVENGGVYKYYNLFKTGKIA